jgi:hypothetical protein
MVWRGEEEELDEESGEPSGGGQLGGRAQLCAVAFG